MFDTILKAIAIAVCTFPLWIWIPGAIYHAIFGWGKHDINRFYDDFYPDGTVWYVDGVWYVRTRHGERKPRRFSERSNPLDHEFTYTKQQVPPKFINVAKEVEY